MRARRTTIELLYEGKDISRDIAQDLVDFTWNDHASGELDDISLTLANDHGRWSDDWHPKKGDTVQASIVTEELGDVSRLYCGRFSIDELEYSFPPSVFQIKAVSMPLGSRARRKKNSRAWEDASLEDIAQKIASDAGLSLIYDVDSQIRYDRMDQRRETDLGFLLRIAEDSGCCVKVTDGQIVVYERAVYAKREAAYSVGLGSSNLIACAFNSQAFDLYSDVVVSYYDPEADGLVEVTVRDDDVKGGMTARISKRAKSFPEAERLAKAELERLNNRAVTGKLTLVGNIALVSAATLEVSGFGAMSGKYVIDSATHTVGNGYIVTADVHRVGGR